MSVPKRRAWVGEGGGPSPRLSYMLACVAKMVRHEAWGLDGGWGGSHKLVRCLPA